MNRVSSDPAGTNYENRIGMLTRHFSPASICIQDQPFSDFQHLTKRTLGLTAVLREHKEPTIRCLYLTPEEEQIELVNTRRLPVDKFSRLHGEGDEAILDFARMWGLLSAWNGFDPSFEPLHLWRVESALLRVVMLIGDTVASAATDGIGDERLGDRLKPCIEKARGLLPLIKPISDLRAMPMLYAGIVPVLEDDIAHVIKEPSDYKEAVTQIVNHRLNNETYVHIEPRSGFLPVIRPGTLLGALYTRLVFRWQGLELLERKCQGCGIPIDRDRSSKTRFCKDFCRTAYHNEVRRRAKILQAHADS
jgi:hypothetical protein